MNIYKGSEHTINLLETLKTQEKLMREKILTTQEVDLYENNFLKTPNDEEKFIKQQSIKESGTLNFNRTREHVIHIIRTAIKTILDKHQVEYEHGADFGSGASGAMVHNFLKNTVSPSKWMQVELNPKSVNHLKKIHPESNIIQGSYHKILTELPYIKGLDIATGLSSLDNTKFIKHAIEQMRGTIKEGGHFLHIQDVGPGNNVQMEEIKKTTNKKIINGLNFIPAKRMIAFEYKNKMTLDMEIFRQAIGRAIKETAGLELIINDWITATSPKKNNFGVSYINNMALMTQKSFDEASFIVTLAKKI